LKKIFLTILVTLLSYLDIPALNIDSLRTIITNEKKDSLNYKARIKLGYYLLNKDRKSAIIFADSMIHDAKKKEYSFGEMYGWVIKANAYRGLGIYDSSLVFFSKCS